MSCHEYLLKNYFVTIVVVTIIACHYILSHNSTTQPRSLATLSGFHLLQLPQAAKKAVALARRQQRLADVATAFQGPTGRGNRGSVFCFLHVCFFHLHKSNCMPTYLHSHLYTVLISFEVLGLRDIVVASSYSNTIWLPLSKTRRSNFAQPIWD